MAVVTLKNPELIKRIYFVGIKGVGMASLAEIASDAGFVVSGSDVSEEFITDSVLASKGIKIDKEFNVENLEKFVRGKPEEVLVITTAAHNGLSNPQSQYALDNDIQILTHGQALGYFMTGELFSRKFKGISVLGCHGKTTVTAMLAVALSEAGLDPTYSIGTSEVFPLGPAGHLGAGEYFVAEADEFISDVQKDRTVKFLYQYPKYAVINNIDFDHPDVYKDLDEVKAVFLKFCLENIQENGTLIINGDDLSSQFIIQSEEFKNKRQDLKVITYGEGVGNNVMIVNFKETGWSSEFEAICKGSSLGIFDLSVPGYHNAKNMLAIISFLNEIKTPLEQIKKAVAEFKGTKRRQERIGVTKNGAEVIDDYAHHPDEIDKTLAAIKESFPDKKVVCLFQPHTLSRTRALWEEFSKAFSQSDKVLFLPIFTSKREGEQDYKQLYNSIKKSMQENGSDVTFLPDTRSQKNLEYSPYFSPENRRPVVEYLREHFDSEDWVIVTLGAGDLYRIGLDMI